MRQTIRRPGLDGPPGRGIGKLLMGTAFMLCVVLSYGGAVKGQHSESKEVTKGGVPTIEAVEFQEGEISFHRSEDEPMPVPNHPPIDQIPPMPMPEDTGFELEASGPGAGILYDPSTGEMREWPVSFESVTEGFVQGGGYPGADGGGGDGDIERPASFGDMSLISTSTRASHPWRMNVKLVMRFGTDYFVCSGTMRDAETVLTAGHCVFDYGGTGWADEMWVYPAWDGAGDVVPNPPSVTQPYGWARAERLGSWTGWTDSGDWNYDVGLVGVTRAVGVLTGWFGYAYGGSCSWHTSATYHNASYPAEDCPLAGLHNGRDMYYWSGNFDSCPSWNRLQIDTGSGCYDALWGGMSGSGAYYIDGDNRYVHGIASTSDRATYGRYARQWEDWVNWSNGTFIPDIRGSSFDVQALDANAEPATIRAGNQTTLLNHLATNPTNGSANGAWTYRVYLSTNDNISSSDTLLSTQFVNWNFGPMSSVRVNMVPVTIPSDTPPGDYYIGVEYDPTTDFNSGNNGTDGWDAVPITVTAPDLDITQLSAPATAEPGDTISVQNTVRNIGSASSRGVRLGFYLSTDTTCTTADTLLSFRTVPSLAPDATSTQNTSVVIPAATTVGTKYVCGIADDLGQVAESNENNNTAYDPINIVGQPDLDIISVSAPPSASPGETILVSNSVRNIGTDSAGAFRVGIYLSSDAVCTTGDTLLTSRSVPSLARSATSAASTPVTIPGSTTLGTKYVCAIADDLSAVVESNEGNNTGSDVMDIEPLVPTVNLKINGADAVFPMAVTTDGPVKLTLDMTPGSTPVDHYWAIIAGGTVYWVTPSGISTTPAPAGTFTPIAVADGKLLDTTLSPGTWIFAWLMVDGGSLVGWDIIQADVTVPPVVE